MNKDLVIKPEELAQIRTFLGEIPHKFGGPIDEFFKALTIKREQEEAKAKVETSLAAE